MQLGRLVLTAAVIGAYTMLNRAHEIVSPLVSGPIAAQQLTDSNTAYVSTQVVSSTFNGAGTGLFGVVVLVALLAAIWYQPIKNLFVSKESR